MATRLLGIEIQEWTVDDLHRHIASVIESGSQAEILNVNVHAFNLMYADPVFLDIMRTCDAIFCDGEGVRLAANRRGGRIPYRITYADWIFPALSFFESHGFSVFFLGGRPEVVELAAKKALVIYPNLRLVGCCDGFLPAQEQAKMVAIAKPQILVTGMGMPLQEKWIRNWGRSLPVQVFLSGGAVFDYLAGLTPRAPSFMCRHGLEWLFRFWLEPGRMFFRYVVGNPLFAWRVWRNLPPE